jgi:hypothetical protein
MLYSVRVTPAACGRIPLFYLTAHNIRSHSATPCLAPSLNGSHPSVRFDTGCYGFDIMTIVVLLKP